MVQLIQAIYFSVIRWDIIGDESFECKENKHDDDKHEKYGTPRVGHNVSLKGQHFLVKELSDR